VATVVAVALLDLVEGDLQDHLGLNEVDVAELTDAELEEEVGELLNLLVGDAAVGLADVDEAGVRV
jgi:hypothetical protein